MTNCRHCGAKLPSFSFGEASPYCETCRSQLPPVPKREAIDAFPAQAFTVTETPLATYALLAINITVFVIMVISGVDWINPAATQVLPWGADYGPYTLNGQYWRLITSMFLHFGIIHIAGNMWCLWSLGNLAERLLGPLPVIGSYLLTGIGASILSLSWDPMRVSAGASGAIFGIAGVLITVLYYGKHNLPREAVRRLLGYVVRFSLLNLLFGLQGHIDNMAHVGGLVSGLLIGFFLARTFNLPAEERDAKRRTLLVVSTVLLILLFVPVAKAKQYAVEFTKGKAAYEQSNYQAAIDHMQKYTSARPSEWYPHAVLGASSQKIGRTEDAIREYELVLSLNPKYHDIRVYLCRLYLSQDQPEKAVALFKDGTQAIDKDADAMYFYGNALVQAGHVDKAESALRKSLQLDDKLIEAHELLAVVLKEEGKTDEARREQHRADLLQTQKSSDKGNNAKAH